MVRVLIVDDQALVRRGFRMILDDEPDITVVGEAATGFEAASRTPRSLGVRDRVQAVVTAYETGLVTLGA